MRSFTDEAVDADMKGPPAHYGRRGKILVLGWHRGRVAATLRDSAQKKDLLNLSRGQATVDAEGPVSAFGLFSGRQLLAALTRLGSEADNQTPSDLRALRYLREMSTPMATMPPTVFTVKRLPDGVRVEFRQSELPAASATVVDMALTWLLDEEAASAIFNNRWRMPQGAPAGAGAAIGPGSGGGIGIAPPPAIRP